MTVPFPVLFNEWKHHAGALRRHIAEAARAGEPGLRELAGRAVVIGTDLMDLYVGDLSPEAIAAGVLAVLGSENRLSPEAYRAWIEAGGGYRVLTLPEDGSRWVVRSGEGEGRYVHLHPGRRAPATLRVRANVLKTAVLVLGHVGVYAGDALDVGTINRVRNVPLGLAPIGALEGEQGLRGVIEVLRAR